MEQVKERPTAAQRPYVEDGETVKNLLKELSDQVTRLVRSELDLARKELQEKAKALGRNAAMIAGGWVLIWSAWLALLTAGITALIMGLWAGMKLGIAVWLAPLIIGVFLLCVGGGLAYAGYKAIRKMDMTPRKMAESMRENKEWLKSINQ